jgi:TRAP transporter TAXI family solute receptor
MNRPKRNKQIQLLLMLIIFSVLFACNNTEKKYKIAISDSYTSLYQVGIPLIKLLEKEMGVQFEIIDTTSGSVEHIKLLSEGKVDFAIALATVDGNKFNEVTKPEYDNIRTISPLYNQSLFIIYPDSLTPKNLGDLIRGRRIGLGVKQGGTAQFTMQILKELGIDSSEYTPIFTDNKANYCNNEIDVSCSFTSFNNNRIVNMLSNKNMRMFSLGDVERAFSGSSVDGICKKLWIAKPQIVPKNSYYSKPEKPVLTVSVFTSLLCSKNLDKTFIQDITETIINNKSTLIKQNPVINQVSEDNLNETLFYPLHPGVHLYQERYQPSFLERYAEVIALLLSITLILSGGLSSYRKWNLQRKKDRIDVYYEDVLKIDRSITQEIDKELLEQKIKDLYQIRERAFDNLIKEKLSADESFKIFTELISGTIKRIEQKIN